MRPAFSVLLGGIVGLLLVSREVGAQSPLPAPAPAPPSGGGLGHLATSLCDELIIPNNYNCIEYQAVTDDGFILGIQNMPTPRGRSSTRVGTGPPVLLQHGLTAGGDNWVANNPQESLAFILADAGFDVWITNSRAIQWSHGHKSLTPSQNAYWAWTYDELASYDLKTSTEFAYNKRGKKLSYVGHSLGTTILFAGLTQGRFNSTILGYLNAAVMLAPIAISTHLSAPLLRSSITLYSTPVTYQLGAKEYSTYAVVQLTCGLPLINPTLCYSALTATLGPSSYTNQSRLGIYTQYFPQSTSTYNINHLGQGLINKNFAFYDKGNGDNMASYGLPTPPNYDLTKFPATLPMQYWTGGIDGVADPTDAATILALLPSSNREVHTLANYGHIDFTLGHNAYIDVYPSLVTFLTSHA